MLRFVPGLLTGLVIGNFIVQAISPTPNWGQAIDRSFYQALALGLAMLLAAIGSK